VGALSATNCSRILIYLQTWLKADTNEPRMNEGEGGPERLRDCMIG
jgi:hypothetical protein